MVIVPNAELPPVSRSGRINPGSTRSELLRNSVFDSSEPGWPKSSFELSKLRGWISRQLPRWVQASKIEDIVSEAICRALCCGVRGEVRCVRALVRRIAVDLAVSALRLRKRARVVASMETCIDAPAVLSSSKECELQVALERVTAASDVNLTVRQHHLASILSGGRGGSLSSIRRQLGNISNKDLQQMVASMRRKIDSVYPLVDGCLSKE